MLWLKALHIIAVVCWFAALFYLPRLFVYHVDTRDDAGHDRFVIMERKLYRGIMTPSMIASGVSAPSPADAAISAASAAALSSTASQHPPEAIISSACRSVSGFLDRISVPHCPGLP